MRFFKRAAGPRLVWESLSRISGPENEVVAI
jgi:hypothetical protein